MSSFNLGKKLLPAKKAWKSFTATFQTKLHKFKLRKAIKRAKKRCVIAFNYIRPLVSRKFYSFIRRSSSKRPLQRQFYHHHHHHNRLNFPAIYVDELFPDAVSAPAWHRCSEVQPKSGGGGGGGGEEEMVGSSSSGSSVMAAEEKEMRGGKYKVGESSSNGGGGGGGGAGRRLPSWPHFRGVDERAEDFISKFREEKKLEREKSILDFQEMLARGA